ncbi:peroxidase family protein [Flavilitoribacter nigricans]|uniref:peroxidase family protein n=1 Tax=Flavilitoribacter nigricans TaxID=70997 RepID=UPI001472B8F4|nr:peroxidase family protein [Flavilitoribacter nigricans]
MILPLSTFAQTVDFQLYRTYDGSHNNLQNPEWGAAGSNLLRVAGTAYSDGISAPSGTERPNPREVSNSLFAQDGLLNDPLTLSDFCWAWGQFIDHDIGLTPDGGETAFIQVPSGDPYFDPNGGGHAIIPMMRNMFDPSTGTSVDNPRQHPNVITAFIDGSGVYGSSEEHASWLRTFNGGKLKVSTGNLLPLNTTDGELDGPIDPDAPHMDDAVGTNEKLFVAGDVRANENPLLTSFHTLFVRQHNLICDQLANEHPEWSDEQLYQHARKLVGGLIQSIVYDEWLPAMGVHLPEYNGYKEDVNGQLYNLFTGAAFRLGHTLLNTVIQRLDNKGVELPEGNLTLRESFFNPGAILETGSIDPFFKGMAVQVQQSLDARVINDIRNFLFGPPGAGGLDLASININRGRERGLPDFNTIRATFGLPKYILFQQFSSNAAVFTRLFHLYLDIDDVDPWVGMLSEDPMPGALFGETIMAIMERQFTALRDGDRFYYLNDPVLTQEEKDWISRTTLRDVIMYNTTISLMQDNVFKAMPHAEICDNMTGSLNGSIRTEAGNPVPAVDLDLVLTDETLNQETGFEGRFTFESLPSCKVSGLSLRKDDDIRNGLSTLDMLLIQKHILGLEPLDSPYKMIAADADRSGNVSVQDILAFRRVILGLNSEFPNNTVWRFVPASLRFESPENAITEELPEVLNFNNGLGGGFNQDFIAVKIGDVNSSAKLENLVEASDLDTRTIAPTLELVVTDIKLRAGEVYRIPLRLGATGEAIGLQFGLQLDPAASTMLEPAHFDLPGLGAQHIGRFAATEQLTLSWGEVEGTALRDGQQIMELEILAQQDGKLSDFLWLDDQITAPEAYTPDYESTAVTLQFETEGAIVSQLELGQNYPNPFREFTRIPFQLPQDETVELRVVDNKGRVLYRNKANFNAGKHEWVLESKDWPAGVLYYQLSTTHTTVTRRMILN